MTSRELSIQKAIKALHDGLFHSERQAAEYYSVPRSTLRDRLSGKAQARASAHAGRQRLSPDQEDFLTNWVIEQACFGYPPTHTRVREMASRMLQIQGDLAPLGKLWVRNYVRRNPRVASAIGKNTNRRASISTSTISINTAVVSSPTSSSSPIVDVSPTSSESPISPLDFNSPISDFNAMTDFGVQASHFHPVDTLQPIEAMGPRAFFDADDFDTLWK